MIVISRSVGEAIRLGEHAIVRVEQILGDKVKLGIEVGPAVPVHRGEIVAAVERLREEGQAGESDSR